MLIQKTLWESKYSTIVACADARALPVRDDSIDLVVTSPPYNCGISYDVHDDGMPHDEYMRMLWEVWSECYETMKPGARICVVVPLGTGRNPFDPIGAEITISLNSVVELLGTVVWHKGAGSNDTAWGSWRHPVSPSLRDVCELVIVGKKPGRLVIPDGVLVDDGKGRKISPWLPGDLFTELTRNVWHVQPQSKKLNHPAPFPPELAERLIRLYGFPGCLVIDPFCGSGSTGVACRQLGCNAVMCDLSAAYCSLAFRRSSETV